MSWFDDQIAYAKQKDDEVLSEAYINIVGAVVGRRIQQAWQDESRAAKEALEDICKYYHLRPREVPESIKDLNAQLDYALQPCGIMRRMVKLRSGWYKDAVGAMLAVRKADGKVLALIPQKLGRYAYRDFESGKLVTITGKNEDMLEEEAVVFYRPLPLRAITMKDLVEYMRTSLDLFDLIWYFAAMAVITLLGMISPKLTHLLFSTVLNYGSHQLLVSVIVFMASVTVAMQIIGGIKSLLLNRIGTKLSMNMEAASMMRLFSLPTTFFRNYTSGELSQHISYFNSLCDALVSSIFSTSVTGVFSLVYVTQIFQYSPSLVIPSLLILLVTLIWGIITVLVSIRITAKQMDISSKENGMIHSIINGMQKIRTCGAEKRAFARWGNLYAKQAQLQYSPPAIVLLGNVVTGAISIIGTVILYYKAVETHITMADYNSFMVAYSYVATAFASLVGIASTIANIQPVLKIVKPIMDAVPELAQDKEVVTRLSGSVEVSHLSFRYGDASSPEVLKDVSFRVNSGQYVAIVGESGCGKSTLMRILLGFEKPQKGAVYYDRKNIENLDIKSLRRKIGVVMQNGKLIWGDIFSNIVISAPWLKLDDAWEAAEIAGIADDIRAMPMGMHTIIQEGSGGISGGQRQRIMIARAVAAKPKILFLDEATSALDNITQKHVSDSMDKMHCTRLVIAHRLSTIRQCDRILFLKDGVIAEDGTYEQLIEKNGYFADLVRRQMVTPE